MNMLELIETRFPTAEPIKQILPTITKYQNESFITGDKLEFPEAVPKDGFKLLESTILVKPLEGEEEYERFRIGLPPIKLIIEVDSSISEEKIGEEIGTFLDVKRDEEWKKDKLDKPFNILNYDIVRANDEFRIIEAVAEFSYNWNWPNIASSPFYDMYWNKIMGEVITEGVCYSKFKIPDDLRDSLRKNIDELAKETEIDYHPNSNDVVRDLVHPALYSYIKDVSELKSDGDKSPENKKSKVYVDEKKKFDFWRRPYEVSKFQWLRTPFTIYHQKENAPFTNISIILIKINFQSFIVILKNFLIYFCHFLKKFGVMLKRWSFGEMIVMMTMILETTDEMFSNSIKKTSSSKIKSCK